jgi:hypothetical protein
LSDLPAPLNKNSRWWIFSRWRCFVTGLNFSYHFYY